MLEEKRPMSTKCGRVSPRVKVGPISLDRRVPGMAMPRFGLSGRDLFVLVAAAGLIVGCDDGEAEPDIGSTVQAIGAEPVNHFTTPQTANEDSPLLFSALNGNGISVSDDDNTNLVVELSTTNGTFTLSGTSGLAVTGNGTLSVNASGSILNLNQALQNSHFQATSNFSGAATLQINSSDNNGEHKTDAMDITVTPFNDSPVNVLPTGVQAATEDVPRSFTFSVTDPDVGVSAMTVSLTASNSTLISLPTTSGLTFSAGDGGSDSTMTFSGTLTSVNTALNGLVVTPAVNFIGASTLIVTCDDQGASGGGGPGLDNDTINISWSAVNDAPVNTVPGAQTTPEDVAKTFSGSDALSVADVDATSALVRVTLTAASGAVSLGTPGLVTFSVGDGVADATMTFSATLVNVNSALDGTTFSPTPNFFGSATLTMVSNDLGNTGSGGPKGDTDPVTITVAAVNDPPNAVDDAFSVVGESTSNSLAVRTNDSAAPDAGETLSVIAVTIPDHGTAEITGTGASTAVRYIPTPGYDGPDAFTYTLSDGNSGTDNATVVVTVTPFDFRPVAAVDTISVAEDVPTLVDVLDNDTGLGDPPLTVAITVLPLHGTTAVQSDRKILYTPADNYAGSDLFTYRVTDEDGDLATARVNITVTPVDDRPVAVDDVKTIDEDSTASISVALNDTGLGDPPLTMTIASNPLHGSATPPASGIVSYEPTANFFGTDTFRYTVRDVDGDVSTATVTITVTPVNDPPVAVADVVSTRVGEPVTVAILDNDVELDGDTLAVVSLGVPLHGTATLRDDGTTLYTPQAGYTGTDTFDYTIDDGNGEQASAAVHIGVGLDSDGDGLLDADEIDVYATDPLVADTDGDKLSDGVELRTTSTNPLDDDIDDDGLLDGNEDVNGNGLIDAGETSATAADSDGDKLLDGTERGLAVPQGDDTATDKFVPDADPTTTTDPAVADTDGGTLTDGEEDLNHDGRYDEGENDPNDASDDVPRDVTGDSGGDRGGGGGCRTATGGGPSASGVTSCWVMTVLALFLARRRHRVRPVCRARRRR
jgi:hypothetical protein